MRLPWTAARRTDEEIERDERRYQDVRTHLKILVRELAQVTIKVEDKARRLAGDR